jgi:hypothetical protein
MVFVLVISIRTSMYMNNKIPIVIYIVLEFQHTSPDRLLWLEWLVIFLALFLNKAYQLSSFQNLYQ